ncbi:MAG: glycoside hydrolase family 3 C-terminal domain-containing protein, partial [Clostridia bacterium]|nr:glycoside hydrolase family 3 C-terminal domain-containing protein [Clostridia bacterium]
YKEGYKLTNDGYDETLFNEAIESAKNNEKVILFVGLTDSYECEGYDRKDMTIPTSHSKLIEAISEVNENVIVVMLGGSPVEMPWIDKVHTLLNAYLPGEAAGEAIADIIYGIVNPSGKLAETYPVKLSDNIVSKYYVGGPKTSEHREGLFVGYRYFDSSKKDVLFPFGHGLSYTTFEYSNLKLSADKINDSDNLTITFDIKNTGAVDGAEVAQIYVKDIESSIFRPEKELKGFKKVFIPAGETVSVTIELDKRSFAYYNVNIKDWAVESGDFEIMVGASSRDIKLTAIVNVRGNDDITHPNYMETAPVYYNLAEAEEIPVEQFEAVYGDKMPPNVPAKRGEFDKNTTIGEMKCCIIGKLFCKFAPAVIKSQVPDADMTTMLMLQQGMEEMPMRGLSGVTSGLLDNIVTEGIILWGNKHRMKGLGKMLKGLFLSVKNIRKLSSETKVTRERKKIKEEKKRLKLERQKLIRDQEDHIKALEMEMDELNKILRNIDDPTKLKEYKAQQKKNIQNIKSNIEEIKVQSQKDLEDMKKKGKIEVQSKRTEEKEIKKALKEYLQNMDN